MSRKLKFNTRLDKAEKLIEKSTELLRPLNNKIADILDDECAHFVYQEADGMCIAFNNGFDNAPVDALDLDLLFKMSKDEAMQYLTSKAI